jgi:hypothetical protein
MKEAIDFCYRSTIIENCNHKVYHDYRRGKCRLAIGAGTP